MKEQTQIDSPEPGAKSRHKTMRIKTEKLMDELGELDSTFARCWNNNATAALEYAIANAPNVTGRALSLAIRQFRLNGRQETVLEQLLNFNQGREVENSLYILSGGQIKA